LGGEEDRYDLWLFCLCVRCFLRLSVLVYDYPAARNASPPFSPHQACSEDIIAIGARLFGTLL
jgi:hypothetical protein